MCHDGMVSLQKNYCKCGSIKNNPRSGSDTDEDCYFAFVLAGGTLTWFWSAIVIGFLSLSLSSRSGPLVFWSVASLIAGNLAICENLAKIPTHAKVEQPSILPSTFSI